MSIQKKSLISTLKTAKKANVASAPLTHVESDTTEGKNAKVFAKHSGVKLGRSKLGVKFANFAKKK
jgi:hypothetical protein